MMKNRYLWILLSLLFVAGCESLEDTYSDYAGDGTVRYLGMCEDITVSPGWERLIVEWKNSIDPVIEKVKVTWTKDGVVRDTLLESTKDSCNITGLEEGVYEITVCNIGKNGEQSLGSSQFARPYTYTHESVIGFTRLISRHFFVEDHLVVFFTEWQDYVTKAEIKYYKKGEDVPTPFKLTKEVLENKYFLLPDEMDLTKPVTLEREGRLEGCTDLIKFNPEVLLDEKLYTSDFRTWMLVKYGQTDVAKEFSDTLRTLEIDYSIRSIEDILNFPKLEKLILGKNRYAADYYPNFSELQEQEVGIFVLTVAHQLRGLKVERYSEHYFGYWLPYELEEFVEDMGVPNLPELNYLDNKDWVATCNQIDENNSRLSDIKFLFDRLPFTYWQFPVHTSSLTYEVEVDMKELRELRGVSVQQRTFNSLYDDPTDLPDWIQVQVSTDKILWESATYADANTLGQGSQETTLINFSAPRTVRYVKFIFTDPPSEKTFQASLAEIRFF